jgi:hypothetical protein
MSGKRGERKVDGATEGGQESRDERESRINDYKKVARS